MRYSFLYTLKYTYSDKRITMNWSLQDEKDRKARVTFISSLEYDDPQKGGITWERPDGSEGRYIWGSDLKDQTPADAARIFLIMVSQYELRRIRESAQNPAEHTSNSLARERWHEGALPGEAAEVIYPIVWFMNIDEPVVNEVLQALLDQYDGLS